MNILIIGIVVLAVVAVVSVAVSLRGRDSATAFGQLSNETVKRDRSAIDMDDHSEEAELVTTGKAVEAAARADRSGSIVKASDTAPVAYVPPDPETIGVARRQFLNRSIVYIYFQDRQ